MKKKILNVPGSRYGAVTILRWMWRAWRGNRLQAVLNAVVGLADVAVSLGSVWAMQRAVDVAAGARHGSLWTAVALMAGLIVCGMVLSVCRIWIKNILGIKAQNRMQRHMLDRLLRSGWSGRETRHSGDVINRLEQDTSTVVQFLTETLPGTTAVVAMFIGAFCYLMRMDATLALITVGIMPVFLLLSRFYMSRMRRYTRMVRDSDSRVQSILQETVQHRMLIKTLECGRLMLSRLDAGHASLRYNVRRRTGFSVMSGLALNAGFSLGYLVAFVRSAVQLSRHAITFGGMTAFLQLVYRIQAPARDMTKLAPAFVAVFTAAERLMELEEESAEPEGEHRLTGGACGVRLCNVSYAYEGKEERVIDRLSFDFRPGTCTAILGETGAGKTTLLRLILALLRPADGRVEIYDEDETVEASPITRCNFVYVPQGNTLMSGTIRDNMLMGNPAATDDDMRRALLMACADFVFGLPDGLDTVTTEAGGGLSEGQAQRISIARALLRRRPIMLFDEATSALDPDTERRLLNNILSTKDNTVIFITHRQAVVEYCDETLPVG